MIFFLRLALCGLAGQGAAGLFLPAGWFALRGLQDRAAPQAPWQVQRTLDSEFLFSPPDDEAGWERRREELQAGMLVSLGLSPMPDRMPLHPVIHGRIDRGDYTVEKVYFESFPGLFVTGNLYRPTAPSSTRRPGVLCPHGHFRNGRFLWSTDAEVAAEIAAGAEQFPANARSVLQSCCASLARMGCVAFHYDMIGYADSQQIPEAVAHGFRKSRPELETDARWGLFSPQAELRMQSVMGLQTWNSIRALDFLESLPDVDPRRIAVTGASGGGTQTFILCAVDPRPAVAFPAVMVSTAMQGGCTCENCCGLRVAAGNVDFAALTAPRPLGLTAANDWTWEMGSKGFPELRQLWNLLGRPEDVSLLTRRDFGHNYNQVSREAIYDWFNRHLGLGLVDTAERELELLTPDQLSVFDEQHPAPPGGPDVESKLMRDWDRAISQKLFAGAPWSPDMRASVQSTVRTAVQWLIARPGPARVSVHQVQNGTNGRGSQLNYEIDGVIPGLKTPVTISLPPPGGSVRGALVLLSASGAAGEESPELFRRTIQSALDRDFAVLTCDLIHQGRLRDDSNPDGENRLVPNGRRAAGYTFGYNRSVIAWRANQILDLISAVPMTDVGDVPIALIADRSTSLALALAAPLLPSGKAKVLRLDPPAGGFAAIRRFEHPDFQPGSVRYGDVWGLISAVPDGVEVVVDGEWSRKTGESPAAFPVRELRYLEGDFSGSPSGDGLIDWLSRHWERRE